MPKRVALMILTLVTVFAMLQSHSTVVAHTPSPPIDNDAVCNIDLVFPNAFTPVNVTIRPPNPTTGESVKIVWVNHDSVTHTVTTGPRSAPDGIVNHVINPGQTYELNMTQSLYAQLVALYPSGNFPYHCSIHFGMDANLKVDSTADPIPELSFPTLLLAMALITGAFAFALRWKPRKAD